MQQKSSNFSYAAMRAEGSVVVTAVGPSPSLPASNFSSGTGFMFIECMKTDWEASLHLHE